MKKITMIIALLGLTMVSGCGHYHSKNDKACSDCKGHTAQSGCSDCGDKKASSACPDCKPEVKK
jgi:predicted amidophosphoribosyltransferase